MLERLDRLLPDPILGLMAAFRADPDPRKVDLGVGVYRDDQGDTPVLKAVRQAEQAVLARQNTKSYVAAAGNPGFNQAMERLVFGADHPVLTGGRVRTIQAPGGCGSLRLGAELIKAASPDSVVHVSTPTWANHIPLLSGCGLKLERYPYFDPATGGVNFSAMLATLERLPARAVVLLHASCHNPTGADLSEAQWCELLGVFKSRGLLPFIDMAYQGLGTGVAEDAFGIRLFCSELPEVAVAVSSAPSVPVVSACSTSVTDDSKADSAVFTSVCTWPRLVSVWLVWSNSELSCQISAISDGASDTLLILSPVVSSVWSVWRLC